jgi:hypothetical protein
MMLPENLLTKIRSSNHGNDSVSPLRINNITQIT